MFSRRPSAQVRAFVVAGIWTVLRLSSAQQATAQQQPSAHEQPLLPPLQASSDQQSHPDPPVLPPSDPSRPNDDGKQSKRILGIFPNYRAVDRKSVV